MADTTSPKIRVTYDDGSIDEFNPNRPRWLLDMEKKFGVQTPERHEHVAWLAHRALAYEKPFDDWIDTVAEIVAEGGDEVAGKADQS